MTYLRLRSCRQQVTNDLTATTTLSVKVGDAVLVTGKVHVDKDFGHGYKYEVILEDAHVGSHFCERQKIRNPGGRIRCELV